MTHDEARAALVRLRTFCLAADPAGAERAQCLHDLAALEGMLVHPGQILTTEELVDEALAREDVVVDVLDQLTEGAIVGYLAARQTREEAEHLARLSPAQRSL